MRSKILGLELILAVVEKPGTLFLTRKEFIEIVKHTLCDGLIKYCVSQEKQIFALSTSIFYCLFLNFREHLKQETYVFIQTIFIKILDSGNSNYHHKYLILGVFEKLANNTKHMLEIFLNFDCQQGNEDIFSKMMDTLSKIAQGKFSKTEHSYIITPQEEFSLRLYALQIMVTHLRGMNRTIEAENAEDKIQNRASITKNSQIDNTSDDGEETKESGGSDNSTFYGSGVDNYEKTRQMKNEITKASIKFNMKPKNGITYMQSKGYICKEPKEQMILEIVHFLKNSPQLDKTMIGDYLGEDKDVNKGVLYEFIDSISFVKVTYVDSLRNLL
jgi:Sec7-like guanine-nucleotide exchange factor